MEQDSDDEDTYFKGKTKGKAKKGKESSNKESEEDVVADKGFDDDFFMDDGEGVDEKEISKPISSKSKNGKKVEEMNKSFTYVPDVKKQQLDKKKEAEQNQDETPFETMQRKLTEKRKARKAAKKLLKNEGSENIEGDRENLISKKAGKKEALEREAATTAELELLLSDEDEGYDMRALHKQEMESLKGPKGKRKRY